MIEFAVSPDRVFAICDDIVDYEGDHGGLGAFGFQMWIRDDKGLLVAIGQPSVIDRKSCSIASPSSKN